MSELLKALEPFVYGFAVGYFAYPAWTIVKKIWSEARKAQKEW